MKVELDLSNYATKTDLKNATGVDTSSFAKKTDLSNLLSDVGKLDIDKFKKCTNGSINLKIRVHKLDVDNLVTVPVDLSKIKDVVKNDVKKDVHNAKIKNIEDEIPDIANLATHVSLSTKINEVKRDITSITDLATTAALTNVENKIPNVGNLVKKKLTTT